MLVAGVDGEQVDGVRDAFLDVFKRATVKGIESQAPLAAQLVGAESARDAAVARVARLRENISIVPQNQVIVTLESFLQEQLPGRYAIKLSPESICQAGR